MAWSSVEETHSSKMPKKEYIGITESKDGNFSEWYTQVVLKAKLADYAPVKGMIVLRPDGYAIWETLRHALDERFAQEGVSNAFLPVLIPESLLVREKSHFEGFNPEVYWVTHSGDTPIGDRLALRPTSETVLYHMYSKWVKSWRDLPMKLNFWNTALRAEIKSTKPFLRTSEFLWQEGHTVHESRSEAEAQVEKMLEIYQYVTEQYLAIPIEHGRKSAKEQFVGGEYTLTIESIMPDGRALQMGTSHMLGQNFAKPFSVKYADQNNVEHYVWQTSWGVSWRLLGAMIMVHGDDRGLVLPPRMAPIQVVIVPILFSDTDIVMGVAKSLSESLHSMGVRTHIDTRENVSPGFKFNDWELRGVPLRVEVGSRDLKAGTMVMARRDTLSKDTISVDNASETIQYTLDKIQQDMLDRARQQASNLTGEASEYVDLREGIRAGGFWWAFWCGKESCENTIKEETGADIRLLSTETGGSCILCQDSNSVRVLFARGY